MNEQVNLSNASNVSCGFEGSCAWTFFDLSMIYDKYKESTTTVIQADFVRKNIYYAPFIFLFVVCILFRFEIKKYTEL